MVNWGLVKYKGVRIQIAPAGWERMVVGREIALAQADLVVGHEIALAQAGLVVGRKIALAQAGLVLGHDIAPAGLERMVAGHLERMVLGCVAGWVMKYYVENPLRSSSVHCSNSEAVL